MWLSASAIIWWIISLPIASLSGLAPDLPEIVDEAMMTEKYRIVGRRRNVQHVTTDEIMDSSMQQFKRWIHAIGTKLSVSCPRH
jgi:hypothetical protein